MSLLKDGRVGVITNADGDVSVSNSDDSSCWCVFLVDPVRALDVCSHLQALNYLTGKVVKMLPGHTGPVNGKHIGLCGWYLYSSLVTCAIALCRFEHGWRIRCDWWRRWRCARVQYRACALCSRSVTVVMPVSVLVVRLSVAEPCAS